MQFFQSSLNIKTSYKIYTYIYIENALEHDVVFLAKSIRNCAICARSANQSATLVDVLGQWNASASYAESSWCYKSEGCVVLRSIVSVLSERYVTTAILNYLWIHDSQKLSRIRYEVFSSLAQNYGYWIFYLDWNICARTKIIHISLICWIRQINYKYATFR